MLQDKKVNELIKIMELIKKANPQTWRREYPPKIFYKDSKISSKVIRKHFKKVFKDKKQKIGAYFHIPFCKSRCGFCEFYSVLPRGKAIDNYLNLLEKELLLYDVDFKENSLDNLYLGGGTPSMLSEKQILNFFKMVNHHFKIKSSTSILTEGTPETSTYTKLKLFKELGVSRYTIGAQCFDERVLKLSRRLYSVKDIYNAVLNTRRAGIKYINLDILLGLQGETEKTYHLTLQAILDLKPDCVSFMIFDQGFGIDHNYAEKANKSYFWQRSLRTVIFTNIESVMEAGGYVRIKGFSGSIFVLRGKEESANRNILNRNYSNPTIGFGVSAESSLLNLKFLNKYSLKEYTEDISNGRQMGYRGVELTEDEAIRRYFIKQYLFFNKINKKEFAEKFGSSVDVVIKKKFAEALKDNYFFKMDDSLIISFNMDLIRNPRKFQLADFGGSEYRFLTILKYFYPPKIINLLKKLVS